MSVASWPQLWALQLVQADSVWPESIVTTGAGSCGAAVDTIQRLVAELRGLRIDQAEWGCLETLVIAGKGTYKPGGSGTEVSSPG